jgi:hypothetical protein
MSKVGNLNVVYNKPDGKGGFRDVKVHDIKNGDQFLHMGAGGGGGDIMIANLIKAVEG